MFYFSYDRLLWRLYHEWRDKMETKFRCWDKENDRMIYPSTEGVCFELDDDGINILDVSGDYPEDHTFPAIDSFLMQSTGLKDKNGVEIFEGDMVKKFSNINKFTDDFTEDIEPTYGTTSIVRDGACFKTTFKGEPSLVLDQNSMSMVEHMEVVGNIYENPELLDQSNES